MKFRGILLGLAGVLLLCAPVEAKPLKVVTTLSTYADLVKQVGQEHVDVSYVASPRFNPHYVQPKPSHVLKLKRADLFVHSGLDLEVWRGPLLDAAGNRNLRAGGNGQLSLAPFVRLLDVPTGQLTRAHGDVHVYGNPHYWLSPGNVKSIVQAIADKLATVDEANAEDYREHAVQFVQKLDQKRSEWLKQIAPFKGQEISAYHDEWVYLFEFLGLHCEMFLEPRPGLPPTPKHLNDLSKYMKENQIGVVVGVSFNPKKPLEQIAAKTGATVAMLSQNIGDPKSAGDYFAWMDYNVNQLVKALKR